MSDELHPGLNDIETALAAWSPRPVEIERDRLMYAAGRAAAACAEPQPRWASLWQTATGLATAAAVLLAFVLWHERTDDGAARPARTEHSSTNATLVEAPARDQPSGSQPGATDAPVDQPSQLSILSRRLWPHATWPQSSYLAARNRLLTTPVDEWPRPTISAPAPGARGWPDEPREPATMRSLLREFLPPKTDSAETASHPIENVSALSLEAFT